MHESASYVCAVSKFKSYLCSWIKQVDDILFSNSVCAVRCVDTKGCFCVCREHYTTWIKHHMIEEIFNGICKIMYCVYRMKMNFYLEKGVTQEKSVSNNYFF